jgi:8-oxo-dGTP pyrophosphatase MutT (NUDIX family)
MDADGLFLIEGERANPAPGFQTAHAILLLHGEYVLQLRDSKPNISAPGLWALFGGTIRTGETPPQTIRREIYEELSLKPAGYRYLWFLDYFSPFVKGLVRGWFFVSDVSSVWAGHRLNEGQAVGAFRFEQIADLDMLWNMRHAIERYHGQMKQDNDA